MPTNDQFAYNALTPFVHAICGTGPRLDERPWTFEETREKFERLRKPLLAVLELHSPITPPEGKNWLTGGREPHCAGCSTGDPYTDENWPCETAQAIKASLL